MQFNVFPHDSKFDFMRLRWVSASLSVLLLVLAFGAMAAKGFNFALDFTGGVGIELRFAKPVDVDQIRNKMSAAGFDNAQVQSFGSGQDILIRLQDKGQGTQSASDTGSIAQDVLRATSTADNPAEIRSSATISAQVGKELALNGIYALLFVIVGFLAYISFRFELKFALAAIVIRRNAGTRSALARIGASRRNAKPASAVSSARW